MSRTSTLVLAVVLLTGCEQPTWPSPIGQLRETDLCFIVAINEYNLLVTPVSIGKPVKVRTSVNYDAAWFTPVEWRIDAVLFSAATPGRALPQIGATGATVTTLWGREWTELNRQRTIGVSEVDGQWQMSVQEAEQFTETADGWRRQNADYSWANETFRDPTTLEAGFRAAGARPDCQRTDWLTPTQASVAQLRQERGTQ